MAMRFNLLLILETAWQLNLLNIYIIDCVHLILYCFRRRTRRDGERLTERGKTRRRRPTVTSSYPSVRLLPPPVNTAPNLCPVKKLSSAEVSQTFVHLSLYFLFTSYFHAPFLSRLLTWTVSVSLSSFLPLFLTTTSLPFCIPPPLWQLFHFQHSWSVTQWGGGVQEAYCWALWIKVQINSITAVHSTKPDRIHKACVLWINTNS